MANWRPGRDDTSNWTEGYPKRKRLMDNNSAYTDTTLPDPHEYSTRACYEIHVKDYLDPYWWPWFDGWTVTNLDNGEVLLRNGSADQSALHGALNKIRDLNLTLVSVYREKKTN
jgi:hypothetical protein